MLICDQEFDFSVLNAEDIDRVEAAQTHMQAAAAAEAERVKAQNLGYADQLRGQCRLILDYLDEVLGEGASAKLGLDGNDLRKCFDVTDAFRDAIAAEKKAITPSAVQPLAQPAAMQMVERVDKAARRKQLLAELETLENA